MYANTGTIGLERRWSAFALLGAVQVTLIATITVITVALPVIQRELRLDETDLVFATSAYGLAFGGLLLLGGRLADLLGHRRVLTAGLVIFGLASFAAGLAPALWVLVVARFGQGAGAALAAPAAMALVGSVFPDARDRTRALALWGVFASVGAGSGVVLSGLAVTWLSWRWIFILPGALALLGAVAATRSLPPAPPRGGSGRLDLPGAVLGTAGLASLIYGLGEAAAVWIGLGVVLLGAFGVVQTRTANPLVPPRFLASAARGIALTAIALTAAGMATTYFLLALYFQQERGFSPLLTSAAFIPPALAVIAAGPLAARALTRLSPGTLSALGLAIAAFGLLLLALLRADFPYVGLVLFPIGAGLTFSSAMVTVARDVPDSQAGLAGGVANTAMEVGPPVGLALLVPLGTAHGYGSALGVAALAFALTAVLATIRPLNRRK